MTITELIAALEALRAEHGDLRVRCFDDYEDEWGDAIARKTAGEWIAIEAHEAAP